MPHSDRSQLGLEKESELHRIKKRTPLNEQDEPR